MSAYIPSKGDLITLSFDPQAGHEQRGRRPAIVISNTVFNRGTGMAIVCPITNTNRGIPFHLALPSSSSLTGFVMVEQVKAVDYSARNARYVEQAATEFVDDVVALVEAFIR